MADGIFLKREPVPGMLIWDLFDDDLHSNLWVLMQQCRLTQEEQSEEILIERDGRKAWCDVHVHPSASSHLIVLNDVTLKNRSLERVVEEERFSAVGMLAGGIAHQYNNIHHSVLGFLETSLRVNGAERDEIVKKAIHRLEMGASLTASLLDFSRGHNDKGVASFPLSDSLIQVEAITRQEFLKYGCTLTLPNTDITVRTNKVVFEQILIHLLINGIHACITSPKKEITVHASCVGESCSVYIGDTGCGISESHQRRIFTPFFSTKGEFAKAKSPYSKIRGNGLGLALSQRLARQLNGDLTLCKTSKRGTVFKILIPRGELKSQNDLRKFANNKADTSVFERKLNFAILDDLPENRLVLRFYLKSHAANILEYDSGDVAIEELDALGPDVIFVDWLMPGFNGNDFLLRLKMERRSDLLKKVFVLSGFNNSKEIETWRPLIGGVIEKPISRDKLFKEVLMHQ